MRVSGRESELRGSERPADGAGRADGAPADGAVVGHADRLLDVRPEPWAGADTAAVLVIDPYPLRAAQLRQALSGTDGAAGADGSAEADRAEPQQARPLPSEPIQVLQARTVQEAREVLAQSAVKLILCNPAVAEDPGDFFRRLTEHASGAGVGVVAIGGDDSELTESELYEAGADAYLADSADAATLTALARSQLRKLDAVRRRVLEDPVTGWPSVELFRETYRRASHLADREHERLSLLVFHVEGLREIRRSGGPSASDGALRQVAEAVAKSLRRSDVVGRGHGDSLLVLLPATDPDSAWRVAEKVYNRVQRLDLDGSPSDPGPRLFAGVALAEPGRDLDAVLETALVSLEPLRDEGERAYRASAEAGEERKARVLLAEDDELTAAIIRHRLERAGLDVTHVPDGSQLMETAPEMAPDLMVIDVKIPYVDGFEALRRLRSMRPVRKIPIMMVTSMGSEEDIARGFELGADDYLVKPFSPVELHARIQRLLVRSAR